MATAREWIDQGNAYMSRREFQKAVEAYTQAIQLRPNDALGYGQRGFAYANLHNFPQALADFTMSIRIDPNDLMAYYGRGLAYFGQGDKASALHDLQYASTSVDPSVRSSALGSIRQLFG